MRKLDFTIVTPSYNYSQYIRETLDSVVAQEGVTVEHLVYDAGSTDGTLDIIREYNHVHLTVEADRGMSDAINKGFRAAKGKWIMWLNTDDRLKPGALAKVKAFAEQNNDADVIYGAWDFIDGEGNFTKRMQAFPFQKLMLAHVGCYVASTSTFFRRSTVMDEGHFLNERFKCGMDGEYYCRLAMEGKRFQHFPQLIADFRMHGKNLSQKHLNDGSVDGLLDLELQYAESRVITRAYGKTFFKGSQLNSIVDAIFYYWFRLVKGVLKLLNPPKK